MCDASGALRAALYSKHINHECYPYLDGKGGMIIYCANCGEVVEELGHDY